MYGAILGDIIGSPYEFDFRNIKTKDFPLFSERSEFTDDTVMTVAIAEALMDVIDDEITDDDTIKEYIIESLKKWGHKYPHAGYGARFTGWLENGIEPYNSFGNGSAMRVSSVGWLFYHDSDIERFARLTAEVTHNHPEGIKGAKAVASVIVEARYGSQKSAIRIMIQDHYYNISRSCDEIRPTYRHVESCQETVPEAITAFLEGESFEDVIRTAVSLGGDSDTLTCIAGSMAEAYFGIPEELIVECRKRLSADLLSVVDRFYGKLKEKELNREDRSVRCPVCGEYVFKEDGDYDICCVCGWENDGVQLDDPDYWGGANTLSLNEHKSLWKRGKTREEIHKISVDRRRGK